MNKTIHRILIIDDNPAIHDDLRKILAPDTSKKDELNKAEALLFGSTAPTVHLAPFEIDSAYQGQEGLQKVKEANATHRPYSLAFIDVRMPPGWDGIETVANIWQTCPELQIVVCTAYSDYSWNDMVSRLGHTDSMVVLKKPFDTIEVLQIAHALSKKWSLSQQVRSRMHELDRLVTERTAANLQLQQEITERTRAQESLKRSEERFSKAFRASPAPMVINTLRGSRYVDANEAYLNMTGYSLNDLLGRSSSDLSLWCDSKLREQVLLTLEKTGSVCNLKTRLKIKSGDTRDIIVSAEVVDLETEPHVLTIAQDVSEQVRLENQLRQAQKMEAVGQLAAGVAHDFNNILQVISMHARLRLSGRNLDSRVAESLTEIAEAADRAASLTRQLLAFSSRQVIQKAPLNLNLLIRDVSEMLRRLIGEHIDLHCELAKDLPAVFADQNSIEQVIVNLAVNARDAMASGGRLSIRTGVAELDNSAASRNHEARPGRFATIIIEDNGCGMDAATMDRIFEPFFTTKQFGKGTGLGLATTFGYVKQHDGWIEVTSTPGHGSTFTIFLPGVELPVATGEASATAASAGGRETILLVEDEDAVRKVAAFVLEEAGYKVLQARHGVEAINVFQQRGKSIDLLVTDMLMPNGWTGKSLAKKLLSDNPLLKIIYTSGYSADLIGDQSMLDRETLFLAKPYAPEILLNTVRRCLDRETGTKTS